LAAGSPAETASGRPIEISLFGGYGLIRLNGASFHQDAWNYYQLADVRERTDIRARSKNVPLAAAEVVQYISPRFGLGVFFSSWETAVDLTADFDFQYGWTGGGGDARTASWTDSGSLGGLLLAPNAYYRFGGGRYDGIFYENEINGFELTAEGIRYVLDNHKLSPMSLNPSSFQLLVGLKLKIL